MKRIVYFAVLFLLAPLILFEYFVLFWFWGGADAFNFFATPITFILYIMGFVFVAVKKSLGKCFKIFAIVAIPILTIITVWLVAQLCGVKIVIM